MSYSFAVLKKNSGDDRLVAKPCIRANRMSNLSTIEIVKKKWIC